MNSSTQDVALRRVGIVTSIHPDFDSRIWKHARLLASRGIGVDLICPWEVEDGSVIDGVTFRPFRKASSRAKRLFQVPLRVLPRLQAVLPHVDLVHFHDIDLLPWLAGISLAKPVVYDVHENYAEEMLVRDWIPKPLRRPLSILVRWGQFALASVIRNIVLVAPSQHYAFRHRHFNKMYLYNFASQALLEGVQDDYMDRLDCVVFIGSQHINNGSLLLLDIVEATLKRVPNIRFIATDRFSNQVFRQRFADEVTRRGIDKGLLLIPNVKPHELMEVLNLATIGISPNLRVEQQINGIHTKLFEYMAAGLPMVVSDLPHQVEVLEHSDAGLLAQPENAESFAAAIEQLVSDRQTAKAMGLSGRQAFKSEYCYESQADTLLSFYRTILKNRP